MSRNSTKTRHSYVAFYPSDWLAGTARMTRLVKSVYHDICLYNWDKNEAVPPAELMLMLADLETQGEAIVDALVKTGKLMRNPDGSVYSERAMIEAAKSFDLWQKKSQGGKKGASTTNGTPAESAPVEPEPEPEPEIQGANAPLSAEADETPPEPDVEAEADDAKVETIPAPRRSYNVQGVAQAWNEMAARNGLAQIKKMTEERMRKTRARLDEHSDEDFMQAISLIPERPFCMGQNERGWKADYDFMLKPNTITKLIEGTAYMGRGNNGWKDA